MAASTTHCWWSPFRELGNVKVLHVDLTPHATREAFAFSWLDDVERSRWQKFEHPGARRRFLLCRAALRATLCGELGCRNETLTFGEHRHGKPFALVDQSPAYFSFNVSHSGDHGLIALAQDGRLGVDIEERTRRRDFDRLIDAAFGLNEQADLKMERARGEVHLFFKLWTVKEALIKALGTGLSLDPATFEAPEAMRRGAISGTFRFQMVPAVQWQVEDIGHQDFAAALVYDV